jgi:hypothetical protein
MVSSNLAEVARPMGNAIGNTMIEEPQLFQGPMSAISDNFMMAMKFAQALQYATLIPDHLRGTKKPGSYDLQLFPQEQIFANVLMVCNRAVHWGVDPIALIACSYVVGGKLDFEGKVIAAVVNKLGGLREPLKFEFSGEGEDRTVIVSGRLKSESVDTVRTVDMVYRNAATKDKQGGYTDQWKRDPDQKLAYSGAKKWARRHTPGVVLGLFADEDEEDMPAVKTIEVVSNNDQFARIESFVDRPNSYVRGYEERLVATSSRDELQRLVDKIKAEPQAILSRDEVDFLVSLAKMRWGKLPAVDSEKSEPVPADDKHADPLLDDVLLHYEMMIQESESVEAVQKWVDKIDRDESVPIKDRKALGKLANDRVKQGFDGFE